MKRQDAMTGLRVFVGAILGILAWAAAFFVSGFLIVWPGWPTSLRTQHEALLVDASTVIAIVPCVVALGVIFRKLFKANKVLCALAAMGIALVVASAVTFFPPGSWGLVVLPLLLGPALVVQLLSRSRI